SGPSEWFSAGRWPPGASGSASATPGDLAFSDGLSISCTIPRVTVNATIGGVAGPYVALAPSVSLGNAGASVSVAIVAGATGSIMGLSGSVETTIATWTP